MVPPRVRKRIPLPPNPKAIKNFHILYMRKQYVSGRNTLYSRLISTTVFAWKYQDTDTLYSINEQLVPETLTRSTEMEHID